MTTDNSLLEDDVIFQSFGPLDEALHFGVIYIWLTFVVTFVGINYSSLMHIQSDHHSHNTQHPQSIQLCQTCDERLCLATARKVGHGAFHVTHSHLSTHQVGHCGRDNRYKWQEVELLTSLTEAYTADILGHMRLKISG